MTKDEIIIKLKYALHDIKEHISILENEFLSLEQKMQEITNPEELALIYDDLVNRQVSLGIEFEDAIYSDLDSLYEE